MRSFGKAVVIACLLITGLAPLVFAEPPLVKAMAAIDLSLIPVAAFSNQVKVEATKTAAARLQSQWTFFFTSVKDAFPGDKDWAKGLETVKEGITEAVQAAQEGNVTKVHEVLEGVRNTMEALRENRNIVYYLDGFSKFRRALEKTTVFLNGKKASDLSNADIRFISSMVPALKSSWASIQAANLNADLFHLDSAQLTEIRSAMDAVQKNIAKLESVAPGGTSDQVFETLNLLKPSLKKSFLLFVKI